VVFGIVAALPIDDLVAAKKRNPVGYITQSIFVKPTNPSDDSRCDDRQLRRETRQQEGPQALS